jgi:hypothetical protein
MEVGKSTTKTILASKKWNDTQIRLVAGEEYHFKASGQWRDWTIVCNADGYTSPNSLLRASERFRRVPKERWFALIGTIQENEDTFLPYRSRSQDLCEINRRSLLLCQ